jgi:transcriptional regulator with XRE-family HTH domain
MDLLAIGRLLFLVRLRSGLRQSDVAAVARLSTAAVARHEHASFSSIERLRRHAEALGLRVDLRLSGRGGETDRLADDEHAAIAETLAALLRRSGRTVEPEVSYNEWGERGRFDLLGHDGATGAVDVVEVKGELTDLQELLGTLDTKSRLAMAVARRLGWPARKIRVIQAVAATGRNRMLVASHPTLFAGFEHHQLSERWLRDMSAPRLLLWVPAVRAGRRHWIAGRRRVRKPLARSSAAGSAPTRSA